MLSAMLFGLDKQPNTHTPTGAMGGVCLLAGTRSAGKVSPVGILPRMWSESRDRSRSAEVGILLSGAGGRDVIDRRGSGSGKSDDNITVHYLTFAEPGARDGALGLAFENLNRIGQSRSRKRHRAP
jgi:hypothetical protein